MCSLFIYITICLCFVTVTSTVPETLRNGDLEKFDEGNDVEILRAVVNSIREWERRKMLKEKYGSRLKRQTEGVCYADLGCFESSGPFSYLDMLPDAPDAISTKFLMYPGHARRRSGSPAAEVPFGNLSDAFAWARRGFNSSLPTKVLVHGFGSDCSHIWVYELRSALMAVEEANIICVDWSNGATLPNYVKATANTRLVGKQLSMLLKGLVDNNGLSLKKLHLIGFSLGAHVAGFAGAELGNLSRITGLDPAGPLFESQDPRARLDQTDAEFVDVIHSNGENLILGGLGSWQQMGHVDFYPNGGRMQKGCSNIFVGAVSDIIWSSAIEGRSLCNHRRAYKFFTDSVSPRCHFPAFPCDSYESFLDGKCFPCVEGRDCGNMGYYADKSKGRGQLYLVTRDEEPFCAYQYLLKVESSPSEFPIITYGRMQVTLVGDSLLNETFTLTKKDDEEFKMGDSVSRIIVPHPVLLEPAKIQVVYTAYSGWLTSGLLQWKIDKVTLSDSFGKTYSVCKRNLILDSGIPVTLRLYPGDCTVPTDNLTAEDRIEINASPGTNRSQFIPTPVVKIGNEIVPNESKEGTLYSFDNAIDAFTGNWPNEKENRVDSDVESSRAFNTRLIVRPAPTNSSKNGNGTEIVREIVEPILKPHAGKIGRSHDLSGGNKEKSEISEPILGPTTGRTTTTASSQTTTTATTTKPTTSKFGVLRKSLNGNNDIEKYNFYDVHMENDWVPTVTSSPPPEKWKRQDDSRPVIPLAVVDSNNNRDPREPARDEETGGGGLNAIVRTVQFLPQRIARMLEEAEKYARERILPLVSNYTPRFISDFIAQRDRTRYIPVTYEETTARPIVTSATTKCPYKDHHQQQQQQQQEYQQQQKRQDDNVISSTSTEVVQSRAKIDANKTFESHIQKIPKRNEKLTIVYPIPALTTTTLATTGVTGTKENFRGRINNDERSTIDSRQQRDDARSNNNNNNEFNKDVRNGNEREYTSKREIKEIRIELPVFEDDPKVMYIPIHEELIKDRK